MSKPKITIEIRGTDRFDSSVIARFISNALTRVGIGVDASQGMDSFVRAMNTREHREYVNGVSNACTQVEIRTYTTPSKPRSCDVADLNPNPGDLKVGQRVVSCFDGVKREYVLTRIEKVEKLWYGSGYCASADPVTEGYAAITSVDGSWFWPSPMQDSAPTQEAMDLYTPPLANLVAKFGGQTLGLGEAVAQMIAIADDMSLSGLKRYKDLHELLNYMLTVQIPEKV